MKEPFELTQDDLMQAIATEPTLGVYGFEYGKAAPDVAQRERDAFKTQVATFCYCVLFLRACCRKRKTFNPNLGSYGLKHLAEDWGGNGTYVPNGVMIAALIHEGYGYEPEPRGPNARIALGLTVQLVSGRIRRAQ